MNRAFEIFAVAAALLFTAFAGTVVVLVTPAPTPMAGTVTFAAAGDYGFSLDAQSVMTSMGGAGLDFVLGLGDLPYTETSEVSWCNFFESKVGDGRVILIAGNHDTGESSGGNINTLRQHCNFGIDAPLTGDYGKEFYFDFPRVGPLMRIIGTGCGLNWVVDGTGYWSCSVGNVHFNFIRDAIDGARAVGIPWVALYSHKPCLSSHSYGCELGQAVLDLVTSKKVDLLLSAHSHNYQRSKQLTCATDNNYRPECVSHATSPYTKGDGTVVHIVGTGGRGLYPIETNADTPYFAVTNSDSKGYQKYTVTATSIHMEYVKVAGSLVESYDIAPSGPDFSLSANPASVSFPAGQSVTSTVTLSSAGGFTGTVSLTTTSAPPGVTTSCAPSSLTGGQSSTCTLSSSSAGAYTATVTGTSGSLVRFTTIAATVTTAGPTAQFTFSPATPHVNEFVMFDASSSTDSDPGATLQARWDWEGDGTWDAPYSSTLTAQHSYSQAGTYTVRLQILDSRALTDSTSRMIGVVGVAADDVGAPPRYGLTDPARLQPRGPIFIASNANFTADNGVRRGTGTAADPYVISDWLIDGDLYPWAQAMIQIESTTAHVVIENNKIINLAGANHWEAIQLGHWPAIIPTQHVTIRHNHIANAQHAYGIGIREGSSDVRIEANYVALDANYDWVYGIMTDRNVRNVTITGNYVNAYTSGNFHTEGIHLSDTHIGDARRASGVQATRNTVVNATAGGITSRSSIGTVVASNLVYSDYPGRKIVDPLDYPRGIETEWSSNGTVVVGNIVHAFRWGIQVGSDGGRFVSNTMYDVDYAIYVLDNNTWPGATSFDNTIFNTTYWAVGISAIHLPTNYKGNVVDVGPATRTTDLAPVTLVTTGPASRVQYAWAGRQLNLSVTIAGMLLYDWTDLADSQTLWSSWSGSVASHKLTGFLPQRVVFDLANSVNVPFDGSGFAPNKEYNLTRVSPGPLTEILSATSTASGGLSFVIPAGGLSAYVLTTGSVQDTTSPVTTMTRAGTVGANTWYTSPVSVTLTATDDTSGVAVIQFRQDGGAWQPYISPITVQGDGMHTIEYYAVDNLGNGEAPRSISIGIDVTMPEVGISGPSGPVTEPDATVSWIGSDVGSGIAGYEVSVDGGPFEPVGTSTSLSRRWENGEHRVTVKAIDNAGLERISETTFSMQGGNGVAFPGAHQLIPLFFPAIGIALLLVCFFLVHRRRHRRTDEALAELQEEGQELEDFSDL